MTSADHPRRKPLRLAGYDYRENGYYFVTVCTHRRGTNLLCTLPAVGGGLCAAPPPVVLTPTGQAVADAVAAIPTLYPGVAVDAVCIMPDHIHLLLSLEAGRDRARPLPDIIGRLKSYTACRYRALGAPFGAPLWQRGFYDHVIRNDADLAQTRRYIAENPIKD